MTDEQLIERVALEELLDRHIQRCRDAVSACPKWSPAPVSASAASAAESAAWKRYADKLIELMAAAPVPEEAE